MTRTTFIIIAAVIFTTTLAGAASATTPSPTGEVESRAAPTATVQLAGWTGRAKVIIKRTLRRRYRTVRPNGGGAVRG